MIEKIYEIDPNNFETEFFCTFQNGRSLKTYIYKPKDWGIRNNSWSITMRLKGRIFSPYIGTDKNVRLRLNKLTDSDDYWNEYDNQLTSNKTDKKELEKVLKGYIEPNIIKKLVRLNKSFNGFEEWCKLYENKKLKGMDFLKEV